jgi:hypothetical protein
MNRKYIQFKSGDVFVHYSYMYTYKLLDFMPLKSSVESTLFVETTCNYKSRMKELSFSWSKVLLWSIEIYLSIYLWVWINEQH